MLLTCSKLFYMCGMSCFRTIVVMVEGLYIKHEGKQQEASYCAGLSKPIPDMYIREFQNCNKVAYSRLKFQKKCKKIVRMVENFWQLSC